MRIIFKILPKTDPEYFKIRDTQAKTNLSKLIPQIQMIKLKLMSNEKNYITVINGAMRISFCTN